jgi:FecR protein
VIDRKNLTRSIFAQAGLFFILLSLGFASQVWAQTVAGSITAISGSATIARSGKTIPAVYGIKVDVGDHITTAAGSNLTVTLTDGSQLELTDSSDLTIDQNTLNASGARASTKLTLLNGLVRTLVQSTPGTPPNFEVHTPNAVASARGTFYDTDHETNVQDKNYPHCTEFTHVSVYKGLVVVWNPGNSSAPPVEVKDGQKVTVPCGGAPIFYGAVPAGLSALEWGAIGALSFFGAGGAAVIGIGASGGFGSGNNNNNNSGPATGDQ